jgi:hypothetical protein
MLRSPCYAMKPTSEPVSLVMALGASGTRLLEEQIHAAITEDHTLYAASRPSSYAVQLVQHHSHTMQEVRHHQHQHHPAPYPKQHPTSSPGKPFPRRSTMQTPAQPTSQCQHHSQQHSSP